MSTEPAPIRDDEEEWRALGERLRDSREFLGLSQQDVAEMLKLSRPAVTLIEAGKRKVSTLELREFARLYRKPYDWLVGESAEPSSSEDEVAQALYRTTNELSERDRIQLLRFAQFLSEAGEPPPVSEG
jgi:transcriptional regulator with XRE-family HTH domain